MVTPFEFNEFVSEHTLHVRHSVSYLVMNADNGCIRSMIHKNLKEQIANYIVSHKIKESVGEYQRDFQLDTIVMSPEEFNRCIDFAYREGARKVNYNMDLK